MSAIGLGGWHLGLQHVDEPLGIRIVRRAIDGGMKSMANGLILRSRTVTAIECLHYALNLPTSVVITGCDSMEILEQALEAARTFRPSSDVEVNALLARTAEAASRGAFEPFKTTSIFDSTASHPEQLHRLSAIGSRLLHTAESPQPRAESRQPSRREPTADSPTRRLARPPRAQSPAAGAAFFGAPASAPATSSEM